MNAELPFMVMQAVSCTRGPAKGHSLPSGYQARCPGMWLLPPLKRCNFLVGSSIFLNLHKCTLRLVVASNEHMKPMMKGARTDCEVQSAATAVVTPSDG